MKSYLYLVSHCFIALLFISLSIGSVEGTETIDDDFRILLVREGGNDPATGMPSGRLVVQAGYLDGVDEGQSGMVWRKNKFTGQLEIATFEVTDVAPYESYGIFIVRHPDFYVLKTDRVNLRINARSDADVLARAIGSLDLGRCFDALLYFDRIYCANVDNSFVMGQANECRQRVEKRLSAPPGSSTAAESKRLDVYEELEVAEGHHIHKNDLAADLHLKRVMTLDPNNRAAAELRKEVPETALSTLFSPARCK